MVFENPVVKELVEKTRVLWALGHAGNLMGWDTEVYMPREGVRERSLASAEISLLQQKIILSREIVDLVERADKLEGLNDYERGLVRLMKRDIRIAKSIPPRIVGEMARITQEAVVVWREAKARNDYEMFKPYLKRIVELSREIADHLGWEDHPYDALLDLYEEGLRTRDIDELFSRLKPEIKRILDKVLSMGRYPQSHELEKASYDVDAMRRVNREVLELLGYPLGSRARLDESAHPFTIGLGINDVRITTRYEGYDFKRSLLGTVHEFGHATYELQIDQRLMATRLARGVSLGIHEGQSRFWENIVGRSRAFVEVVYPILEEHLGFIKNYSPEEIYYYFNTVRPSLIRTEADEVTYNLHILLRAELEKLMIKGEISVDELPEYWDNYMEEILGVRPRNYAEGVLQDIHWSMGSIGYFPTYTLGNLVAAQMRHHMLRDIDLYNAIIEKKYDLIKEWQKEKIHRWGSTYQPKELLRRAFGEEYVADYFIKYLEEKYLG